MYIGPGLDLEPHKTVATTIAVAFDDPFAVRVWVPGEGWSGWRATPVALIPSEALHQLRGAGLAAFLFLDPLQDHCSVLTDVELARGRARVMEVGCGLAMDEAFAAFGLETNPPADARIARVVLEIERRPDAFARIDDAAALACLSVSRFRARFSAEVGVPFRRYRLWRRMAAAMRAVSEGGNLTAAAFEAGFASPAHLSTAFKRMFGLSAKQLLALGAIIEAREDGVLPSASTEGGDDAPPSLASCQAGSFPS